MSKHTPVHGIAKGPDAVATQRAFRQLDVAISSIEAAISTLEEQVENIQGGVGAVNSVTAGSNMVSVSPTTGDVIVNVVPANFSGIPQSAITNLEADLAGKSDVGHGHVIADITGLQTALDGKIDEVIAGTNLSGGGTSGVVTLNVVDSPTFAGDVTVTGNATLGGSASASHVANGVLNTQQVREKTQEVAFSSGTTVTLNDDTGVLVLTHPSDATLRGITGGADGRRVRVFNNSLAALYLSIEDGLATDVNRIRAGTTSVPRIILNGYEFVDLYWSAQRQRWICEGPRTYMPLLVVERDVILNSVAGSTSIRGNTSIGNALTDAHTANGTLDITGPSNDDVLTVTTTGTGVTTAGKALVHASRTGTFLTSSEGTSKAYGVLAEVSMSEEGSGTTRNIAGRFVAEDGDENIALELLGDVEFDYRLGGSRIYSQGGLAVDVGGTNLNLATDLASIVNINTGLGVTNVAGALNVGGNVTLGDSSGDAHVLNGTLNANSTVGSNGQALVIDSGLPKWVTLGISNIDGLQDALDDKLPVNLVTGTVGLIPKFIDTHELGNSNIADDGSTVTIDGDLTVTGSTSLGGKDTDIVIVTGQVDAVHAPVAKTTSGTSFDFSTSGTFDTSSSPLSTTSVRIRQTAAPDAPGGQPFTATALEVTSNAGADGVTNYAIRTFDGINSFNENSGDSRFGGNVVVTGTVTANGYAVGGTRGLLKIGHQVFTSSGTYTPTTGTRAIRLRMVSGGGGGGGVNGTSGSAAGGGGGSGGCTELWIDPGYEITSGGAVTVGAGGSGGGTIAPSTGSSGGTTSVVIDGTTYFISGGGGGAGATRGSGNVYAAGGVSGGHSGSNVTVLGGAPGHPGISLGGTFCYSGMGGSLPPWGTGGISRTGLTAGNAALGYGAGGGGASGFGGNAAGGAGAPGIVIIEEYA